MDKNLIAAAINRTLEPFCEFEWGIDDCCTFPCDVIRGATGIDLMASLRGKYVSEMDANCLYAEAGGFVALVLRLAKENNLRHEPFPFVNADIGVVTTPKGPILALFMEDRWVARAKSGVIFLRRELGAVAWSVR